jgi:hypothetical protein
VIFSSPEPSPEVGNHSPCRSHAAIDKEREGTGAIQLMPDADSSSLLSEPEDNGYGCLDDFEDEWGLEDNFAKCVIVPPAQLRAVSDVSTTSFLCHSCPFPPVGTVHEQRIR